MMHSTVFLYWKCGKTNKLAKLYANRNQMSEYTIMVM